MSEGRLALKREKEAKLAQKIKEALQPTYIKVDDVTVGSSSCNLSFMQADRCTTSSSNRPFSSARPRCSSTSLSLPPSRKSSSPSMDITSRPRSQMSLRSSQRRRPASKRKNDEVALASSSYRANGAIRSGSVHLVEHALQSVVDLLIEPVYATYLLHYFLLVHPVIRYICLPSLICF